MMSWFDIQGQQRGLIHRSQSRQAFQGSFSVDGRELGKEEETEEEELSTENMNSNNLER